MSHPTRSSNSWISVLPSLVVPVCLGLTLYVGMLAMIRHGWLENELALRYLTGHPVSKVSVAMFLIGACSLGLIAINVFAQFASERDLRFPPIEQDKPSDDGKADDAQRAVVLGQQLLDFPTSVQSHYLWQRLTNSLLYVYRNDSAAGVDEEVKYLAELDLDRQQQRYSLAQILIWATPMLGFLGTVLGISQALGGISVGPDNDFETMMNGLRGSLYVAFDTTALALTLSMVLMFVQFLVDRFETQLLALVDQRARSEISLQFDSASGDAAASDSVERLGEQLLTATREMMVSQTDIWKKTIHSAEQAWASSLTETNERVRSNWSRTVDSTLARISKSIDGSVSKADESMVRRWKQWQVTLSDNARLMCQQQQELAAQTTALQSLVGKTENEHAVQDALKGAKNAMATTEQLTSAIDRLSEHVGTLSLADVPTSELEPMVESKTGSDITEIDSDVMTKLALATSKADVSLTRRKATKRSETRKRSVGLASIDSNEIPTSNPERKPSEIIDEVILPIAPYLSGKKSVSRRAKSTTAQSKSNRKAA